MECNQFDIEILHLFFRICFLFINYISISNIIFFLFFQKNDDTNNRIAMRYFIKDDDDNYVEVNDVREENLKNKGNKKEKKKNTHT